MSKVDAMRAIKEARFAAAAKGTPAPAARRATPTQAAAPARPAAPASDAPAAAEGVCGHRNMGGKSCTREVDHQKTGTKSHRYG